jgi:hypothetical protein
MMNSITRMTQRTGTRWQVRVVVGRRHLAVGDAEGWTQHHLPQPRGGPRAGDLRRQRRHTDALVGAESIPYLLKDIFFFFFFVLQHLSRVGWRRRHVNRSCGPTHRRFEGCVVVAMVEGERAARAGSFGILASTSKVHFLGDARECIGTQTMHNHIDHVGLASVPTKSL